MYKRPHEKLIVWQESYTFCLQVYNASRLFPSEEKFGLTDQIRRASYSVPINIAEGNGRRSTKEKRRFFNIASASLEEVHVELLLAKDLKYIQGKTFDELVSHLNKISYLIIKLSASLH